MDRRHRCALGFVVLAGMAGPSLAQDVLSGWNDEYLNAIRVAPSGWSPGQFARAGAIVHGAIYDAVNCVDQTHEPYAFFNPDSVADKRVAVVTAAHTTLSNLYAHRPDVLNSIDARRDADLAALSAIVPPDAFNAGAALGIASGNAYLSLRQNDGWDDNTPYVEGTDPGDWRSNYPPGAPALGPNWGRVTPWVMDSGAQFRPTIPGGFGTTQELLSSNLYEAQLKDVMDYGSADSVVRTEDQTRAGWFWGNDRDGTYKPPGHLNIMARVIADQEFSRQGLSEEQRLSEGARLMALVNIAMADAGIAAWDSKYETEFDFWRPIAGAREADTDGNPNTIGDPDWEPLTHAGVGGGDYTPPFPAFVSGHATFGAVQAAILKNFFGTDDIAFELTTDDADFHALMGGDTLATRQFDSISEAALENGRSRVYLGVHWQFDADFGYMMGTELGYLVYGSILQPIPAPATLMLTSTGLVLLTRRRR